MLVGEQPGDKEDIQGRPFVGPAGGVLDKALATAGIDRKDVYVTNIVKHFKWEPRGKRRLHKKPNALEISACRPWLEAEINVIQPQVVVLLGATAAPGHPGTRLPRDPTSRRMAVDKDCSKRDGNCSSFVDPAGSR